MKDAHLTPADLARLLEDDGEEIRNRVFLHHLAICPACYEVAGFILDAYEDGQVGLDLCVIDIDLARSRRQAPALWEELRPRSPEGRMNLVRQEERFQSWGLCELLCRRSLEEACREPALSVRIAELAVEVAMLLTDWCRTENSWLCLLRGFAFAHLANAHRATGDLGAAWKAFAEAETWWGPAFANAGDVLDYEAGFLSLKASLLRASRRFSEALAALEEAFAARPTPAMRLRLLLKKAKTYEEWGNMEEAIRFLAEARALPAASDARAQLCLTQNFLDSLSKAERFLEADSVLPEVRPVVAELGSGLDRLRLRWTEARIAGGLGRTAEAIGIFEEVRAELLARQLGYDAAFVALELALLVGRDGRTAEMKALAVEALAIFEAVEVRREALGALALFRQAVESEQVTAELVTQVIACLRRVGSGGRA